MVGNSATDAYLKTETVDQMARVTLMLAVLGRSNTLPADQVSKLIEQRQALGLARSGDQGDFCAHCGVCHMADRHIDPAQADQVSAITARVMRELGR